MTERSVKNGLTTIKIISIVSLFWDTLYRVYKEIQHLICRNIRFSVPLVGTCSALTVKIKKRVLIAQTRNKHPCITTGAVKKR